MDRRKQLTEPTHGSGSSMYVGTDNWFQSTDMDLESKLNAVLGLRRCDRWTISMWAVSLSRKVAVWLLLLAWILLLQLIFFPRSDLHPT